MKAKMFEMEETEKRRHTSNIEGFEIPESAEKEPWPQSEDRETVDSNTATSPLGKMALKINGEVGGKHILMKIYLYDEMNDLIEAEKEEKKRENDKSNPRRGGRTPVSFGCLDHQNNNSQTT
jgi:hypothetical protein